MHIININKKIAKIYKDKYFKIFNNKQEYKIT